MNNDPRRLSKITKNLSEDMNNCRLKLLKISQNRSKVMNNCTRKLFKIDRNQPKVMNKLSTKTVQNHTKSTMGFNRNRITMILFRTNQTKIESVNRRLFNNAFSLQFYTNVSSIVWMWRYEEQKMSWTRCTRCVRAVRRGNSAVLHLKTPKIHLKPL